MTVRISATDWARAARREDAVASRGPSPAHGADAIDVSTGQVVPGERPEFGRSYQTPYADRIRNELGIPVVAVGAISSWDDVNSLLLAGRADLCALGRTHLYDPQWTLHAAADQGYPMPWPKPFAPGSRKPQTGRTDGPKPRLDLIREPVPAARVAGPRVPEAETALALQGLGAHPAAGRARAGRRALAARGRRGPRGGRLRAQRAGRGLRRGGAAARGARPDGTGAGG